MSTRTYSGAELLAALALAQWGLHLDRLDDLIDAAGNDAGFLVSERARIIRIVQERGAMAARADARVLAGLLREAALHPMALQGQKQSDAQAKRRRDKPGTDPDKHLGRNDTIKRRHQHLVGEGRADATTQVGQEFGLSTRRIRQILAA